MPLELHIWGPAFGLPSINAECIAATAYLKSVISIGDWVLVPNHDPSNTSNGKTQLNRLLFSAFTFQ